jgi:carboxypeptidase C (cathepsin A)
MRTAAIVGGLSFLGSASALVAKDEIKSLPGWDAALPSKQYSGYLDVGAAKHLHYWLIEAENAPATAPTVLWLNGGPGCSSLDGMIYEHGPFRVNETDHSRLVRFEDTWAKQANMLYLEAPVGVGFSYSDDKADYATDDDQTALDSTAAMNRFFELYPELKPNDFFITGESYACVHFARDFD